MRKSLICAAGVMTMAVAVAAHAAPGDLLDRSFGGTGKVRTAVDGAYSLTEDAAVAADGSVYLVGTVEPSPGRSRIGVVRLTRSGELDPAFSGDGIATIAVANEDLQGLGIALADDRAVVAGAVGKRAAAFRLNADGTLDRSFGKRGAAKVGIPAHSAAEDVSIDGRGRVVLAGWLSPKRYAAQRRDALVARLGADGKIDRSFGRRGVVRHDTGGGEALYGVALERSRVVLVGERSGEVESAALVMNLDAQGRPVRSFSDDGVYVRDVDGWDSLRGVVVQPGGTVTGVGSTTRSRAPGDPPSEDDDLDLLALRLTDTGPPVTRFGKRGIVIMRGNGDTDLMATDAESTGGSLLIAGVVNRKGSGAAGDVSLHALDDRGRTARGLLSRGRTTIDLGPYDGAVAVEPAGSGKYVVGAYSSCGGNACFAAARFQAD